MQAGEEVIVTDRGRPVARLSALDATDDRLAELIWQSADSLASARLVVVEALRGHDAVHLATAFVRPSHSAHEC